MGSTARSPNVHGVNKATFNSLTASEQALVLETERPRLLEHDEDALLGVFERVRKQRAKAVSQYRRGASARVDAKGARGAQRAAGPHRDALKAEVWEDALGRVSSRLATLSKASAKGLKEERLAAARGAATSGKPTAGGGKASAAGKAKAPRRTPAQKKQVAASASKGRRRQAKRDAK